MTLYPTAEQIHAVSPELGVLPAPVPSIEVDFDVVVLGDCSVCTDGGELLVNDSETVTCKDCGTTWYNDGTGGERK